MRLFPSASVVRERHKRNRNLLYTEPDRESDTEPGGTERAKGPRTEGPRTEGASEKRSKRSKRSLRRMEAARGLSRDLQRIEDEMGDEPILSTLLTASALRRPRGDASEKKSKDRDASEKKSEGTKNNENSGDADDKIEQEGSVQPDAHAKQVDQGNSLPTARQKPRGDAPDTPEAQEWEKPEQKKEPQLVAPNHGNSSLTARQLLRTASTPALISELVRRCIEAGGTIATNITGPAQRYLLQLPTIAAMPVVAAAMTIDSHGDAMALVLLSVILCDATGRVLTKDNVQRVSFALYGLVVSSGMRIQDAIERLGRSVALQVTPIDNLVVAVLGSAIEALFGSTVVEYTKLSVDFIVGAYSTTTIPAFCTTMLQFMRGFPDKMIHLYNRSITPDWAFSIVFLVASVLMVILATRAFQSRGKPDLAQIQQKTLGSATSAVAAPTKRKRWSSSARVLTVAAVVSGFMAAAEITHVTTQQRSLVRTILGADDWKSQSVTALNNVFSVFGEPVSTIQELFTSNFASLREAGDKAIRSLLNYRSIQNGPEAGYIATRSDISSITNALRNATDNTVSTGSRIDSMLNLEQETKRLNGVLGIPRWNSTDSFHLAIDSANGAFYVHLKQGLDKATVSALLHAYETIKREYSQWDAVFGRWDKSDSRSTHLDIARIMDLAATATCTTAGPSDEIKLITKELLHMKTKIDDEGSPDAMKITSLLEKLCHDDGSSAAPDPADQKDQGLKQKEIQGILIDLKRDTDEWDHTQKDKSKALDDEYRWSLAIRIYNKIKSAIYALDGAATIQPWDNYNSRNGTSIFNVQSDIKLLMDSNKHNSAYVALPHLRGIYNAGQRILDYTMKWSAQLKDAYQLVGQSREPPDIIEIIVMSDKTGGKDGMPSLVDQESGTINRDLVHDVDDLQEPTKNIVASLLETDRGLSLVQNNDSTDIHKDIQKIKKIKKYRVGIARLIVRLLGYKAPPFNATFQRL